MHLIVNCSRNSKIAMKFRRPSGSSVINPNNILTVLIQNSKTVGLLKFQCHFSNGKALFLCIQKGDDVDGEILKSPVLQPKDDDDGGRIEQPIIIGWYMPSGEHFINRWIPNYTLL